MLNVEKLRDLRKKKGLSQRDVSARLGLAPAAYGHYENGIRTPNIETACKIAKLYGVRVEHLLQ